MASERRNSSFSNATAPEDFNSYLVDKKLEFSQLNQRLKTHVELNKQLDRTNLELGDENDRLLQDYDKLLEKMKTNDDSTQNKLTRIHSYNETLGEENRQLKEDHIKNKQEKQLLEDQLKNDTERLKNEAVVEKERLETELKSEKERRENELRAEKQQHETELRSEKRRLQKQIQTQKDQLESELKSETERLEAQVESLKESVNSLQPFEDENKVLTQRVEVLESAIACLTRDLSHARDYCSNSALAEELQQQINHAKEAKETKVNELNEEYKKLYQRLEDTFETRYKKDLEIANDKQLEKIDAWEIERDGLQTIIGDKENEIEELNKKIEQLQKALSEESLAKNLYKAQNETLQQQYRQECDTHKANQSRYSEVVACLRGEITKLKHENKVLRKRTNFDPETIKANIQDYGNIMDKAEEYYGGADKRPSKKRKRRSGPILPLSGKKVSPFKSSRRPKFSLHSVVGCDKPHGPSIKIRVNNNTSETLENWSLSITKPSGETEVKKLEDTTGRLYVEGEQKKLQKSFQSGNWGMAINLGDDYRQWQVQQVVPDGQADDLDIMIGAQVLSVDGCQINDDNVDEIRQKLESEEQCTIEVLQENFIMVVLSTTKVLHADYYIWDPKMEFVAGETVDVALQRGGQNVGATLSLQVVPDKQEPNCYIM